MKMYDGWKETQWHWETADWNRSGQFKKSKIENWENCVIENFLPIKNLADIECLLAQKRAVPAGRGCQIFFETKYGLGDNRRQ